MEKEIFCPLCGSSLGICSDTDKETVCSCCGNSIFLAVAIPEGFKKQRNKKAVETKLNSQAPANDTKEKNGLDIVVDALDGVVDAQSKNSETKNKNAKPESKKTTTSVKFDKDILLDDPDPIPFPANTKFGKIAFWIIFALTLLFVLPIVALFSPTLSAGIEYDYQEVFGVIIYGVIFLIALITWLTYWFMRRFKRVDPTKPVAIKVLQWIFLIGFLTTLCGLIMFGGSVKLLSILPEGFLGETSFVSNWASYGELAGVCIYACPACLAVLLLICAINKARFNCELSGKKFSIWSFLFGFLCFVIAIGFIVVILSGFVMLFNLILPQIVSNIIGENAEKVLLIIDKVLMFSSITVGACFILNIFISFKTTN